MSTSLNAIPAHDHRRSITSFPLLLCRITLGLSLSTLVWVTWNAQAGYRDAGLARTRESHLAELRGTILHLDEVLTTSARMAAATGDPSWEQRYRRHEGQLEAAIKEAIALEPSDAVTAAALTSAANAKLVEIENRAFALVRNGQVDEARTLLFTPEYNAQKDLYARGMEQLLATVRNRLDEQSQNAAVRDMMFALGSIVVLGFSVASWILVIRTMRRTHSELEHRVTDRTVALSEANDTLRAEVAERREVQAQLIEARDQALAATRLKGEFLANMSHEIRTPLNGVIGMTGLLLDTTLTRDQRDFAEAIRGSGEALMTVINDILDFSKIEARKLSLEMLDFELCEAIEGSVELVAERAFNKGIELVTFIDPDLPARFRGDAGRIRQIVTNLVGNAVKFTEHGEVVVRAVPVDRTDTHTTVRIEVKDSGIGISRDVQARLFQAFTQADGSTTRKFGGTGLGLAISKELVSLMGGEIGVDSEPGKGSTFWIRLPLGHPEHHTSASATVDDLAGVRLLVVDDHATNRQILLHQTRAWKMDNNAAASGVAALEMLRQAALDDKPYRVAILDMQMPGMDGLTLARTINADPLISATKLVVLTSLGQRLDDDTMQSAGIVDCLIKPVRQARLFDLLASLIGKRQAEAARSLTAAKTATAAAAKKVRVLVAEDNIVNQRVACAQLQKLGYHADVVANGREVIEVLQRVPYDVIFMDCQMPELDGMDATEQIRAAEKIGAAPFTRRVHIVAMTANAMQGDRDRCLSVGMDDYVSKPTRLEDLHAALERWHLAAEPSESPELLAPVA